MPKILTTDDLRFINRTKRTKAAGKLPAALMDNLDPDGWHVAKAILPHRDGAEMRCTLLVKVVDSMDPAIVHTFDIPIKQWSKLRDYREEDWEVDDDDDAGPTA